MTDTKTSLNVRVNDEERETVQGTTVGGLLAQLGLNPPAIVVQLNGDILDRDQYDATLLAEGDSLELVRLVGGG